MTQSTIRIAGVQMEIAIGNPEENLNRMIERAREAAANAAGLVVFPECALSGYCFASATEARVVAQPANGEFTKRFAAHCRQTGQVVVFGFLESTGDGHLFNSAVMVGADGPLAIYRKVHLPFLGVDRFVEPGPQPFQVHELTVQGVSLKVGLNICYDTSFPETWRVLSLADADLILLPTNWPRGADNTARHVINTRALENHVFFAAVNRIGSERGFQFIGQSRICDCLGNDLAVADDSNPVILYADIDPQQARNKSTINIPGEYELHRLADRRPEFYLPVVGETKWKKK